MISLLFIHGFATGPVIWKEQVREFARDFHVTTDLNHVEQAEELFIVGWSMGGWKAIDLCLEHHHKIKGLVLVSAFAKYVKSADYPCGTSLALLRKLEKRFLDNYQEGIEYFYNLVFHDPAMLKLIKHLPQMPEQDVKHWFARLEHDDFRPKLVQIKAPTLIIHGDRDPIVSPETAQFLQGQIKGSQMRMFPGVGHAPFVEAAERFNQLLRGFVNERS